MSPRTATSFGVGHTVSRLTAARVLADAQLQADRHPGRRRPLRPGRRRRVDRRRHRRRPADHPAPVRPRRRARAGSRGGRKDDEHPAHLDRLAPPAARRLRRRADGARGRSTGQRSRRLRQWELWPNDTLLRANLASEAYQLGHLSSWAVQAAEAKTAVVSAMPTWTPLKRAVLGFALRYAGAPYVWGGTSPNPQVEFGPNVAGGFDCSGFVWWVMKMQTYTAGGQHLERREGHRPAAHDLRHVEGGEGRKPRHPRRPAPGRHPLLELRPQRRAHVVGGRSTTPASTSGNGWTINSHGSGDGVTVDYMGAGAGWYHDAFAFGWRIMPMHK